MSASIPVTERAEATRRRGLLWWLPPSAAAFIYTVFLKPPPLRKLAHLAIQRMIPPELELYGVKVALNRRDAIVSGNLALGCYETYNLEFFRTLVQPGMNVLDVGANIGVYSAIGSRLTGPEGRVVAVEPSRDNCEFIRRTKSMNGFENLTVVQRAAGDRTGEARLYLNELNKADHRTFDPDGNRAYVSVDMVRLDDLVREMSLDAVDILKIDVQGFEAAVLDGMTALLGQERPLRILMEFWPWGVRKAGADPSVLLDRIIAHGFSVYEIDGDAGTVRLLDDPRALLTRSREREHADMFLVRPGDPILEREALRAHLS